MSLILATFNGPAFYPLPGIGRMETMEHRTTGAAHQRMKEHIKRRQTQANGTTKRILELVTECDRTIEILADMLEVSDSTVKRHLQLLKKNQKVQWRRSANTVYWKATNA